MRLCITPAKRREEALAAKINLLLWAMGPRELRAAYRALVKIEKQNRKNAK